jgi:hypothetical protein
VFLRVDLAPVHRLCQHLVDVDLLGAGERVVGLQPRQLDHLADQVVEPCRLHARPARELPNGLGVVRRALHRLGQQRDGADRSLQLMTDVGDEVAPGLLDPPGGGQVVCQDQDQLAGQRRHPGGEKGACPPGATP